MIDNIRQYYYINNNTFWQKQSKELIFDFNFNEIPQSKKTSENNGKQHAGSGLLFSSA